MPLAGGVSAPSITPLRVHPTGKPSTTIDTGTYIEIETESRNCVIFFTTNGDTPHPYRRVVAGREITFRYRAPFQLRVGKRTIKAIAVHKHTKAESPVMTKTFQVCEVDLSDGSEVSLNNDDEDDNALSITSPHLTALVPANNDAFLDADESVDGFLRKSADQGFAATNHSGTQINVWGSVPGVGWDVRTPDGGNFSSNFLTPQPTPFPQMVSPIPPAEPGISQEQLSAVVNHLSQFIDQMRQRTVGELQSSLNQVVGHILKAMPKERPPPPPPAPPLAPPIQSAEDVLSGGGLLKRQLVSILQGLLRANETNSALSGMVGVELGKVQNCKFEDTGEAYMLTVLLEKPGVKVSKPAVIPAKVSPKEVPRERPKEVPKESPKKAPEEVPKGQETEDDVRQARYQKAPPISLKKDDKPAEPAESVFFETEEYQSEGTLKPAENFDSNADCQRLRKAMKGMGTDEAAIIDVLGHRSLKQRLQIALDFKTLFGLDLIKELDSELSGNFARICRGLCLAPENYDAEELHEAMSRPGTDEDCLIEIICTRTNAQLKLIAEAYQKLFNRSLEEHVMKDTSGHFKRLLVSLLQANRDESRTFDRNKARKDAEDLLAAGEKKTGTDESKFNEILISRSNAHLRAVFAEYEKMSKNTIEEALKKEMSGDLLRSFLSIVRCIQNKPAYFAKTLNRAMKGLGTDDKSLSRVIVTRCEIDMVQIKTAFAAEYGKSLAEWIKVGL
nr:unnamed protein product [Spirometra erinaceieuropaei]